MVPTSGTPVSKLARQGLILQPHHLEGAYEFLRSLEPIRGWKLPHADETGFKIIRSKEYRGFHQPHTNGIDHTIEVSSYTIRHVDSLLKVMAHEMLHIKQRLHGEEVRGVEHNKAFWKWADKICLKFGWDPGLF